jgi:hypothetical protein
MDELLNGDIKVRKDICVAEIPLTKMPSMNRSIQ